MENKKAKHTADNGKAFTAAYDEEQEARQVLNEIEMQMTNGRGMTRYTLLDLVQFVWFWEKEKGRLTMAEAISRYTPLMERHTAKEMLNNLSSALSKMEEEE